jgi:hypothetical protein
MLGTHAAQAVDLEIHPSNYRKDRRKLEPPFLPAVSRSFRGLGNQRLRFLSSEGCTAVRSGKCATTGAIGCCSLLPQSCSCYMDIPGVGMTTHCYDLWC